MAKEYNYYNNTLKNLYKALDSGFLGFWSLLN